MGRMEALKMRQFTIKNSPVPESAKCFDKSIPWYALEALKPMGRIDGDGVTSDTGYEVAVEWRKECEGLRDKIAQLEALVACSRRGEVEKAEEIKRLRGLVTQHQDERRGWRDRCKANDDTYDALNREHTKSRAECEQLKGRVAELEAQLKTGRQCIAERDEIIERIEVEFERLREENDRLKAIPVSPGTIREIEALHIIIKHMAPLL